MKFKKIFSLLILTVSFGLIFSACEETTSSDGPVIDMISPTTGVAGDIVTITGSGFGDYDQFSSKVYFNGELASIWVDGTDVYWYEDEVKAIVPQRASTGNVTVEVNGSVSNGIVFTVPSAEAVEKIEATSIDKETVKVRWMASTNEGNADFVGYKLFVYQDGTQPEQYYDIDPGTTEYSVGGLNEGAVYNFDIHAVIDYNGQNMLSPATKVKWSPATRFTMNINEDVIKLYASASSFGSGLELYNEAGEAPKTLKVANGDEWDLGLYTSGGVVEFGSASTILAKYSSYSGTPKTCQIVAAYIEAESLDEVYDSQALSAKDFDEQYVDLSNIDTDKNIVFIVRTNPPTYNYAKVMIINNGGFLQGSGDDQYLEVVVSYQMEAGIGYAL